MRKIVLDTETTGLEHSLGHRIIEIGCVELIGRKLTGNNYHQYLQPDRESDEGALEVHGITSEFLQDKPRFADIVQDFLNYIRGAELIIHNAPFDVGFLDSELRQVDAQLGDISTYCNVIDTLVMARKMRPGQKNNLNALCKHFDVNNTQRELHGALLDAEILSEVYLRMTGGQVHLLLDSEQEASDAGEVIEQRSLSKNREGLSVVRATQAELEAHEEIVDNLGEAGLWPSS
ncbi:MAG: DNA polymerase III subunit epsilon [Gammaproteobacteria bacterium]|jgi:DNA polymerase-3 subunit epsilon|nr:DNA polymerase III subunit epsilon [Gammaproteobacteria bacterium]